MLTLPSVLSQEIGLVTLDRLLCSALGHREGRGRRAVDHIY